MLEILRKIFTQCLPFFHDYQPTGNEWGDMFRDTFYEYRCSKCGKTITR